MKCLERASFFGLLFSLISSPAYAFNVTINPPPNLTLDNQSINTGIFTLTGATGYSVFNGGIVSEELLSSPIEKPATIGSTDTKTLLTGVSNDIQAINLTGFFDPTDPDTADTAKFDIILTKIMGETGDYTFFLPSTTGPLSIYQYTDLGATTDLSDNINLFSSSKATLSIDQNGKIIGTPVGIIGMTQGNSCPTIPVNPHGGGGGTQPLDCVQVPESSSTLSLLALGSLGAVSTLKRKLKLSKLTDKEV